MNIEFKILKIMGKLYFLLFAQLTLHLFFYFQQKNTKSDGYK